jgi:cysteinyl-tRNA synthetase
MALRIYDSMQRKVVPLEVREKGRASIYVCGPTVYNYVHIGNARTLVWFDQIRRYLEYRGYEVTYEMNYTDIDDKIIERAKLEGLPTDAITSKYTQAFEADMEGLGVRPPDLLVLCTHHITDMVKAIEGLIEKGTAYVTDEGDVFFAVQNFKTYGRLSGRSLEDLRAGERVEPHPGKKHPLDFALWKAAKEGEPAWPSPWGDGRPGWHIECSVMSTKYLGMGFDIHGGGSDLIFPHHENEVAQAEALEEETFVRHWVHAGMVNMETAKMSKSLGNTVLARDVVARHGGEQARYWCLMGSYRSQAIFSEDTLKDAAAAYDRWATFFESAQHALGEQMPEIPPEPRRVIGDEVSATGYVARFIEEMDDDFNSAGAFAVVHDLVREGNRRLEGAQRGDPGQAEALVELIEPFLEITAMLGFRFEKAATGSEVVSGLLDLLLQLREEARAEKAFDRADAIRARLNDLGITIEDTAAGPRWRLGPSPD